MIYILSYYNLESKNGGANRLESFKTYLSKFHNVDFLSLSTKFNKKELLNYWKNSNIFIKSWVLSNKFLFYLGITLVKDPYYKKQALSYYESKISSSDTLIVSYPTIDDVLIGIKVFEKFNCKLNIDFRDSLLEFPLENLSRFQMWRLKKIFLKIGSKEKVYATGVSSPICKDLIRYFRKTNLITNFRLLNNINQIKPDLRKNINVLYFGSLESSYKRGLSIFSEALSKLCLENKEKEFSFDFFGEYSKSEISKFKSLKKIHNLHLNFLKPTPIENLNQYDFAILLGVPNYPAYVSSKFFSYLELNLPIIGSTNGNQVGEYIKKYSVGYSYAFDEQFILKGYHELKKAEYLYTSDLSIFSSEEVLNKWRNVIS